ncbi:hypothetical protein ACOME3_009930 [Neoechinorhynchus agilis]
MFAGNGRWYQSRRGRNCEMEQGKEPPQLFKCVLCKVVTTKKTNRTKWTSVEASIGTERNNDEFRSISRNLSRSTESMARQGIDESIKSNQTCYFTARDSSTKSHHRHCSDDSHTVFYSLETLNDATKDNEWNDIEEDAAIMRNKRLTGIVKKRVTKFESDFTRDSSTSHPTDYLRRYCGQLCDESIDGMKVTMSRVAGVACSSLRKMSSKCRKPYHEYFQAGQMRKVM